MNARSTALTVLGMLTIGMPLLAAGPNHQPASVKTVPSESGTAIATRASYIVQASQLTTARAAVRRAGGTVRRELGIIDAVSAELTVEQARALDRMPGLNVFADAQVKPMETTGGTDPYQIPLLSVDKLHAQGINGTGVTVAVLDTGTWNISQLVKNPAGQTRYLAEWNSMTSTNVPIPSAESGPMDLVGHGTHISSIILSSNLSSHGVPQGIAPYARLVSVQAFGADGSGSYTSVINGLNWILNNRATYNIRVLNLSFGAKPQSAYWNDPLNQAVMKLWQAGVVVVASAGNSGPAAQTITAPGNVPYVITVGAMTDNFTPQFPFDDHLASFSSTGPTYEGFIKPEIVAPGGHIVGIMEESMAIPVAHPSFYDRAANDQFTMSGTSQSAAVVSGVVALMLQANPTLSPDQVKCRLMASSVSAVSLNGKAGYSVFQQGAGMVNAYRAVYSQAANCANQGLNIAKDIAGTAHYGGPVHQDTTTGAFYVLDSTGGRVMADGYLWNNGYLWNFGYLWNSGYLWNQGYLWNNGYLWNQGYLWNNSYVWKNGYLWNQSTVAPASTPTNVESWNNQE